MPRKGWSAKQVPEGWLQVIHGPRPPAQKWPRARQPAPRVGQTLIAIDPSADDGYLARVADLLNAIEGTPGARLPGARRLAAIQIARDEGICVPTLYVKQARELAGS